MNATRVFNRLSLAKKAVPIFFMFLLVSGFLFNAPLTRGATGIVRDTQASANGYNAYDVMVPNINVPSADSGQDGLMMVSVTQYNGNNNQYGICPSAWFDSIQLTTLDNLAPAGCGGYATDAYTLFDLVAPHAGSHTLEIAAPIGDVWSVWAIEIVVVHNVGGIDVHGGGRFTNQNNITNQASPYTTNHVGDYVASFLSAPIPLQWLNSTRPVTLTQFQENNAAISTWDSEDTSGASTIGGSYIYAYTFIGAVAWVYQDSMILFPTATATSNGGGTNSSASTVIIIIINLFIVLIPAFLIMTLFSKEPNFLSFLIGAIIGAAIGFSAGIVPLWCPILLGVGLVVYAASGGGKNE